MQMKTYLEKSKKCQILRFSGLSSVFHARNTLKIQTLIVLPEKIKRILVRIHNESINLNLDKVSGAAAKFLLYFEDNHQQLHIVQY